jgi:predicted nucleic acid-binding protein
LAVQLVDRLQYDRSVTILEQSHRPFFLGLELYRSRYDKGYSLTDCISMMTMRSFGVIEVLTRDEHFTREGFTRML